MIRPARKNNIHQLDTMSIFGFVLGLCYQFLFFLKIKIIAIFTYEAKRFSKVV